MRDCRARAESLLLLLSSTDAAETLLEAAVHHPRAAAAARRVVGGAQASVFTSAAVLPVRAPMVGVAGLGELERCVTPVSVRMNANRCVLDGYGVSEVRGTAKHRCRALTGAITRVTQKREILVHAGLQHV